MKTLDDQNELPEHDHRDDYEAHLQRPAATRGGRPGMLPGVAAISLYLMLLAMMNAFAAATGKYGMGTPRYSALAFCTLLVAGVLGLLNQRRWEWALVIGGCALMAAGFLYGFARTHILPYLLNGLFALVFFLYLSRTEVRDRLR